MGHCLLGPGGLLTLRFYKHWLPSVTVTYLPVKWGLKTDVLCPEVMVTPLQTACLLVSKAIDPARTCCWVLGGGAWTSSAPETSAQRRHLRHVLVRNLGVVVAPFSLTTNSLRGLVLPPLTAQALNPSHCGLPGPGQQPQPCLCSLPPVCSLLCSLESVLKQSEHCPALAWRPGGRSTTHRTVCWLAFMSFKTQHAPGISPAPDLTIFLPPKTLGSVLQPHPHPPM